jgi:hypothetical protein
LLAELRGLGASLAGLRPDGGTLLRPEDSPQPLRPAPELWVRHRAHPDRATLVVLDGEGRSRAHRTLDASADLESTLLRALHMARVSPPRRRGREVRRVNERRIIGPNASSALTRQTLGWRPQELALLTDLRESGYFS